MVIGVAGEFSLLCDFARACLFLLDNNREHARIRVKDKLIKLIKNRPNQRHHPFVYSFHFMQLFLQTTVLSWPRFQHSFSGFFKVSFKKNSAKLRTARFLI